jgi:hypothetical protein
MVRLDLKMSVLFSGDFHASTRVEIDLIYKDILIRKYGKDILIRKYGRERYKSIKYQENIRRIEWI